MITTEISATTDDRHGHDHQHPDEHDRDRVHDDGPWTIVTTTAHTGTGL